MKEVCVITGGGSGMGLKTAHIMGKTHYVIISGRTVKKSTFVQSKNTLNLSSCTSNC